MSVVDGLDVAAFVVALADLPGMGPVGLGDLVRRLDPAQAWQAVLEGREVRPRPTRRSPDPGRARAWQAAAHLADPTARRAALQRAGIGVTWPGAADWPAALEADPEPPGVLFWRGDLGALRRPSVAVVGTRHATPEGRAVAWEIGRDLAANGVTVVSGLALGVDGAAHAGALEAAPVGGRGSTGPVGVAASGVDVPYPRRHTALWTRVAKAGVIVSETPPGGAPSTWRFPWRNRIIVALADLVVIVESQETGGSMITAEAALTRGTDLAAVPGPVRSPASAGTNRLIIEGAIPVRHAGDILDNMGRVGAWSDPAEAGPEALRFLDADAEAVLSSVGWRPTGPGLVAQRTGLALGAVGRHLDELGSLGLVTEQSGRWARCGPRRR